MTEATWSGEASADACSRWARRCRLLAHLPTAPVVTAGSARVLLRATERTARDAVSRLEEAGILAQRSAGRRYRVFECVAMIDAFTEVAREQPADNLTLLSASRPARTHPRSGPSGSPIEGDDARLCNAATIRGRGCTHPKPRPGGSCPAGPQKPVSLGRVDILGGGGRESNPPDGDHPSHPL